MHDLLIRGARIVDGTGAAAATGDVAVERGVIREAGRLGRPAARRVVAADGAVVAPGFIDLHTHSDFTLPRFPRAPAMTRQGVTTQVLGNCGFSPFPTAPATAGLLRAASAFFDAGLDWDWSDLDGYARGLAELPLACNLALLVGHGSVRVAVMGFEDRAPTAAELEAMRELVAVAMRQGAFGLSSGLIYAPGSFAETAELAELARVAAAAGGFYASHIRDEAAGLLDAMGEAIEIGRRSGAAVQLSHHKAMGRANWGRVRDSLALLERSHAGHDVLADQYPYTAGSTTLLALLPGWAVAGGAPAMRERLADPATRRRVADDLARRERDEPRPGERELDPASVVIADVPAGPLRRHRARSLAEAARDERSSVGELVLRLLDAAPAGVPIVWHGMDEADVRTVLAHPLVAVASDGWTLDPGLGGVPHPRSYGTFVRVLGRYALREGVLSLEAAVRKMTSLPARRLGLADRGTVAPGMAADLVVFDPDRVIDRATYERPHAFCEGVSHVVVNGRLVIDDGHDTAAPAGKVLRHAPGPRPPLARAPGLSAAPTGQSPAPWFRVDSGSGA
jgi:N-acyl-D-amino-acid deacylase